MNSSENPIRGGRESGGPPVTRRNSESVSGRELGRGARRTSGVLATTILLGGGPSRGRWFTPTAQGGHVVLASAIWTGEVALAVIALRPAARTATEIGEDSRLTALEPRPAHAP
jgi:hypothetical protein